ncbi:MAG: hypothetical protein P4L92_21080 [Rudaea sp.]|nr:hypothetical protein [Rudaea sp.]
MREGESRSVGEPRTLWPDHVSGPDRVLFEVFLALPVKERKVVRQMIETLVVSAAKLKRS